MLDARERNQEPSPEAHADEGAEPHPRPLVGGQRREPLAGLVFRREREVEGEELRVEVNPPSGSPVDEDPALPQRGYGRRDRPGLAMCHQVHRVEQSLRRCLSAIGQADHELAGRLFRQRLDLHRPIQTSEDVGIHLTFGSRSRLDDDEDGRADEVLVKMKEEFFGLEGRVA